MGNDQYQSAFKAASSELEQIFKSIEELSVEKDHLEKVLEVLSLELGISNHGDGRQRKSNRLQCTVVTRLSVITNPTR